MPSVHHGPYGLTLTYYAKSQCVSVCRVSEIECRTPAAWLVAAPAGTYSISNHYSYEGRYNCGVCRVYYYHRNTVLYRMYRHALNVQRVRRAEALTFYERTTKHTREKSVTDQISGK